MILMAEAGLSGAEMVADAYRATRTDEGMLRVLAGLRRPSTA